MKELNANFCDFRSVFFEINISIYYQKAVVNFRGRIFCGRQLFRYFPTV